MLVNQAKGIKASLELSTLKDVKMYILELKESLSDYKYKNSIDGNTEYYLNLNYDCYEGGFFPSDGQFKTLHSGQIAFVK